MKEKPFFCPACHQKLTYKTLNDGDIRCIISDDSELSSNIKDSVFGRTSPDGKFAEIYIDNIIKKTVKKICFPNKNLFTYNIFREKTKHLSFEKQVIPQIINTTIHELCHQLCFEFSPYIMYVENEEDVREYQIKCMAMNLVTP